MAIKIIDTDNTHTDFVALTKRFDDDLNQIYGAEVMKEYNPYNVLDGIFRAVVVYCDGEPSACGGIKRFDAASVEIKRIYVLPHRRKLGLGERIIRRLAQLAISDGYDRAVLETAEDMTAAQALYQKCGFKRIENYGPYADNELSVCMGKNLRHV